jgi:hypothetical protein
VVWILITHISDIYEYNHLCPVGFEVLTAVVMKISIFWDIKLATCFHAGFLLGLFFDPEDGGDMFLRNVG